MPAILEVHFTDNTIAVCDQDCYNHVNGPDDCICAGRARGMGYALALDYIAGALDEIHHELYKKFPNIRSLTFHYCDSPREITTKRESLPSQILHNRRSSINVTHKHP